MAYTKQTWANGSAGGTPITAARLAVEEQGIFDAHVLSGNIGEKEYVIPASALQTYTSGATDAVKNSVIANNNAAVRAAMAANPDATIHLDPVGTWPLQLALDGFTDGTFLNTTNVRLKGRVVQPKGTYTSDSDATAQTAGRVKPLPVITIFRPFSNPIAVSGIVDVQFGPNLPNAGNAPFTQIATTFTLTSGGYSNYRQGDLFQLYSNDYYAWSAAAGYTGNNIWRGAFVPIVGIGMTVNSFSLTAASAASVSAGNGPINYIANTNGGVNNGMESRMIKGATSNSTALVQGDINSGTTTNRLIFTKVSGDFSGTENIIDVTTNQVIGTFGGMYLVMSGRINTTYPTSPVLRKVTRTAATEIDLVVETDNDTEDFIYGYNRSAAAQFLGVTDFDVKIRINSGYQRGATFSSCYRGRVDAWVRGLPNHALETELSQGAYGYAVGMFGCSEKIDVFVDAENVRHGFSTNGVGATYNYNKRTGSADATGVLATNYHNYGTVRKINVRALTRNTFAAGIDTHEGAEDITIHDFEIVSPFWGGRNVSNGAGISNRGFNFLARNGRISDCNIGIADNGPILDSGGLVYVNRYQDILVENFSSYGYFQGGNAFSMAQSRTVIKGCTFRGDGTPSNVPYYQSGIFLSKGHVIMEENRTENCNGPHINLKGSGGGYFDIVRHTFDYTDPIGNQPLRVDATQAGVWLISPHFRLNGGDVARPLYFIRNTTGTTPFYYKNITTSFTGTLATIPTLYLDAGTATFTRLLDPGETSGGAATHSTAVAPTLTAQAGAGTGPTIVFASGSTDVSGEVRTTFGTSPTTGNFVRVNYGTAFTSTPFPNLTPALNAPSRAIGLTSYDATGFTVQMVNAPTAAAEYRFTYYVPGV